MSKIFKTAVPIFLISIFLFLRFNNLNNSFFFYNDMGRDMQVLQTWQESGKPPLLGPQTSALPFNQSAIYFYLLYPGYLISQGNPISLVYTLGLFYISLFILGTYLLRNQPKLQIICYFIFFLISISPPFITQGRYVWNPSFVSPLIILSTLSFHLLLKKFSKPRLFLFSFSIAFAISLSYSIAPLLIAFGIYWAFFYRQHFVKFIMSLLISFITLNLPTIFFEIRHHFLLTNSLLTKNSPPQEILNFSGKFLKFSQYILSTENQNLNVILYSLFLLISVVILIKYFKYPRKLIFLSSFLFLTLTFLGFIIPISIQAHYVFAFLCTIFLIIASLPYQVKVPILILLSVIYLRPIVVKQYFKNAPRTLSQTEQCISNYCQNFSQPTFVSVQSNYHPWHNGPEFRYFMKKSGCVVKDIETENGHAQFMTVVVDNGSFSNQTNYYELNLFGKFNQTSSLNCLPNLQILTLQKI